jgi:hypothetical protein
VREQPAPHQVEDDQGGGENDADIADVLLHNITLLVQVYTNYFRQHKTPAPFQHFTGTLFPFPPYNEAQIFAGVKGIG